MKVYKILHKPTGLYFKPSKHNSKSNLSKKGKLYENKPSMRYLDKHYHHPLTKAEWEAKYPNDTRPRYVFYDGYESRPVIPDEWEIVEFSLENES